MRIELPHPSGVDLPPGLSTERGILVQSATSNLYDASRKRRVFTAPMAAAGGVLPIFSNTAQISVLWNPSGSGVNLNVIECALTYVSTTGAAGGYVIGVIKNAGANAGAAGAGITAFTDVSVFEGLTTGFATGAAKGRASSAATVVAPVILRHLGLNQLVLTAADATNAQWMAWRRFEGDLVVAPNTAICLAGNIATLSTFATSFTWTEEAL